MKVSEKPPAEIKAEEGPAAPALLFLRNILTRQPLRAASSTVFRFSVSVTE